MKFGTESFPEDDEIEMLDIPDGDEYEEPDRDQISNVPITYYSNGPIDRSLEDWRESAKCLKFKLHPTQFSGVLFASQRPDIKSNSEINEQESTIYQLDLPGHDLSNSYNKYITSLYKVMDSLGDLREFQQPTIGLISMSSSRSDMSDLNSSFDKIIESLITLIHQKRESKENEERIFDLEELLYILDCLNSNYFSGSAIEKPNHLANWINRAHPSPDIDYTRSIMTSVKPYLHPEFWSDYIPRLLIRGLFNQASNALETSKFEELTQSDNDLYMAISDLQSIINNYYLIKKEQFSEWKSAACEVRDSLSKGNFKNQLMAKELFDIFGIITGLPKTIANHCDTWYEMYVALSLYQVQDESLYNEYYQISKETKPPLMIPNSENLWESTCIDILENNFLKVIRTIEELDSGTSAYIAKFCEAKGLLKLYSNDYSNISNFQHEHTTISDFLFKNHAFDCLNTNELVPIGIGLLFNSHSAQSRAAISEFLPNYYCKTNDDLEWVLSICSKLEIPQTAQIIFKTTARRSLDEGYLFEALTLFARGDDVTSVRNNCWLIFENSLIKGGAIEDELINNIVSNKANLEINPIVRQCLAPYAILLQFFTIQKSGSIRSSIIKLISLLKFSHLPLKFFPLLLSNLLPFISIPSSPRILTLQELIVLIGLINNYKNIVDGRDFEKGELLYKYAMRENILKSIRYNEYDWRNQLTKNEIELPYSLKDLLKLLRKSIANEISRTYLEEA